jgi:hypothetical protein
MINKYIYDFDLSVLYQILNLKRSQDEDESDLFMLFSNHLRKNQDFIDILVNGKQRKYDDLIRVMNDVPMSEHNQSKPYLPKDNFESDHLFKLYFINQHDSFIQSIEKDYGRKVFNLSLFKECYREFISPSRIEFFQSSGRKSAFSWGKYLKVFISSNLLIYDPYILKDQRSIENNLIPFINSMFFQQKNAVLTIISSSDSNYIQKGSRYFHDLIKEKCINKNITIEVFLLNKKLFDDRFIYCNNFYININHSFQAFKDFKSSELKYNKNIEMNPEHILNEFEKGEWNRIRRIKEKIQGLIQNRKHDKDNQDYLGDYFTQDNNSINKFFELVQ